MRRRRLFTGAALAAGGVLVGRTVAAGGDAAARQQVGSREWHARSSVPAWREGARSVRVLWRAATADKLLALTFDDGPDPTWTPRVLAVLAEQNIRATFFVVGERAASHPGLVRAQAEAGHELGNHTWSHADLSVLGQAEATGQLRRTDELIRQVTGARPRLVRPPWGRIDPVGLLAAAQLDYTVALWSQLVLERRFTAARNVRNITVGATPGSLVLLHDGGPEATSRGVTALPEILPEILRRLTDDGYRPVTVSELLAAEDGQPVARPEGD